MSTNQAQSIMVIGLGNESRGDDAAGRHVVRLLRKGTLGSDTRLAEESGEGMALMESWKGMQCVILVDAVYSGKAPGLIHRFDAGAAALPSQLFDCSTHAFGVAQAVELARAMNQLPERLIVYGIEARQFEVGADLSPEVMAAAERVGQCIVEEIGQWQRARPG